MVLFLLNLIFSALTTLSALVSRLIFTCTAYILVLLIQSFKIPGEAIKDGLEQVADLIKSCVEYLMEFLMETISTLVSALFDLLTEGISSSVAAFGSAIGGLVELMRNSLEAVLEGLSEMISTIITDLWNNYKDAVGYVTENA